jgi:hypothetical protein
LSLPLVDPVQAARDGWEPLTAWTLRI